MRRHRSRADQPSGFLTRKGGGRRPPPPGSDGAMPAVAAKAEAEAALAALQGEEKDDGVLESSAPVSASYR